MGGGPRTRSSVTLPTTSPPPGRLPRQQRRTMLLSAARSAFTDRGYHATAMDDIAERAGVSKPVLYQHFDSKLDLYLAITREVAGEIVAMVEDALSSTDDNAARIAACLDSFFTSIDQPDTGYSLLFSSDLVHEPAVAALLDRTRRSCGEAIGKVLAADTDLGPQECLLIGTTVAGLAQTAAQHWCDHQDAMSREEAIKLVTGLLWRGLGGVPAKGGAGDQVGAG